MSPWIWIVPLQVLAVGLLVAEIFLPSAGILVALMLGSAAGSVWMAFDISSQAGFAVLLTDLVILPLVGWKALDLIPKTPAALRDVVTGTSGDDRLHALVGRSGVCETDLRPVGRVRIGNDVFDAQMAHGFLARGSAVKVVKSEAGHLFVEST